MKVLNHTVVLINKYTEIKNLFVVYNIIFFSFQLEQRKSETLLGVSTSTVYAKFQVKIGQLRSKDIVFVKTSFCVVEFNQ